MFKDLICPYCIRKIKQFNFVCARCGQTVVPNWAENIRFRLTGDVPSCSNPSCSGQALQIQCPFNDTISGNMDSCGEQLPSDINQYRKYLRFTILGTTGAGKTNYLTMMIKYLSMHTSPEENPLSLSIEYVDKSTKTIYDLNLDTVLRGKTPVGPTPPGSRVIPQFWRIRQKNKPAASLTIFDGAGEDMESPEARVVRCILGSNQFILLIDPLSIDTLRKRLSRDALLGSSHETDPDSDSGTHSGANLVVSIANFIRENMGIRVNQKIQQPTAVVFTKLDLFMDQFGNAAVTRESPHLRAGCFLEDDSLAVDREIRSWLIDNGRSDLGNDGAAFINAVERNFMNVRFFGVSSFGSHPDAFKLLDSIHPHRVLDPLMWLLAQDHVIETRKPERN